MEAIWHRSEGRPLLPLQGFWTQLSKAACPGVSEEASCRFANVLRALVLLLPQGMPFGRRFIFLEGAEMCWKVELCSPARAELC